MGQIMTYDSEYEGGGWVGGNSAFFDNTEDATQESETPKRNLWDE